MRPFRLLIILAFLTAVGLFIVYLRVADIRTAYRINQTDSERARLSYEIWGQEARIARLANPQTLRELVHTELLPLQSPQLAPGIAPAPGQDHSWETD